MTQAQGPAASSPPGANVGARVALWLGLVPLVAGLSILGGYWWSRNDAFVQVGLLVLMAAPFAWLAGVVLVLRRGPWTAARRCALVVLVADLPPAAMCASVGLDLMSAVEVLVHNRSPHPLEQVELDVTGLPRMPLGRVAPGARVAASFLPVTDGRALMRFTAAGRAHEAEAVGYVTRGPVGKRVMLEVDADLTVRKVR